MQEDQAPAARLSGSAKFGYGVALPLLALLLCQGALIQSLSGTGSWDGIGLALATLVIIPGMAIANCWVFALHWTARRRLFAAGLALPAVLALTEFLWLHGGPFRRIINAAFVAPFTWVWLFVALLFLPLIASVVHVWRRNRRMQSPASAS